MVYLVYIEAVTLLVNAKTVYTTVYTNGKKWYTWYT